MTITRPAQDTTIVLTQENQPILTLQEEHTPTSGKFEPVISWQPSQTINTAEYFEQIEDSLVIVARVTATNIAGMIARDSVKITLKKNVLDHFAVRVERDTVAFTETSKIFVQGKDARDNDIDPPADTKVNIVLRVDERYGNLAYKSTVGKEVIDVPYGDAQSGQVVFAATGEHPIGLEPQKVDIGVTGLGKEGVGSVWVKCTIENQAISYKQADSRWGGLDYDRYIERIDTLKVGKSIEIDTVYFKVRRKGCALTTLAMMLQHLGKNETPGTLVEKMSPDYIDPQSRNILWDEYIDDSYDDLIFKRVDGVFPVKVKNQRGQSLKTLSGKDSVDLSKALPLPLSHLDDLLDKCIPVAVLVLNPTFNTNHFVVVTKKRDNDYEILDPGSSRTHLSQYTNSNGTIYGIRYVEKKK